MLALVDCNSFFASCERVFRPDLLNRPVAVLSNNDGCIIARTQEVKALNIPMGAPYHEVRHLLKKHNVAVFSSNYTLYGDFSNRVMTVLSQFTNEMEVYSIDEAFLQLPIFKNEDDYYRLGETIRDTVYRHTGIPVSVGIGKTKVQAKLANHIAKKYDGHHNVFTLWKPVDRDFWMDLIPVEKVWGIGRQSAKKLNRMGIMNAKEFRDYPNKDRIQKSFTKIGRQIQDELNGINCLEIESFAEKKKQIMVSRSFKRAITTWVPLSEAIATYTTRACEKLRKQGSLATAITVMIRTSPYDDHPYRSSGTFTILSGSNDTLQWIQAAKSIARTLFQPGQRSKKGGVLLSGIHDSTHQQLNWLDPDPPLPNSPILKAMDSINTRYGQDMIRSLSTGLDREWRTVSELKSPAYTTQWGELPVV
ncbi:Y-family DNA polymerase [bacterium]|jgi:DNA polymerase V|nr:Y-family DNA polymerase [bacterium]